MNKTILTGLCALLVAAEAARAQTTGFTYQGRLNSATNAATGYYDFTFDLYAAGSGGSALTTANSVFAVPVTNGFFTVPLNFGDQFPGADRWLEIAVRTNGAASFATLAPRQPLTPTPYAIRAASAGTANSVAAGSIAVSDLSPAVLSNTFWRLTGNAGTSPGANFVGTTDNQPLELKVNGARGWRLEPNATSPNVVGGYSGNLVSNGVVGAFIAGGGQLNNSNRVGGSFSTVGGGYNNVAYFGSATVAGGDNNLAAQDRTTVSGGFSNRATGLLSTVGGGDVNLASGQAATVPGGSLNEAAAAYAFAAGRRAKAANQGAFVWADSQNADFTSTANNQFLIRAAGGVGIGTTNPTAALDVAGTARATTFAGNGGGLTNVDAAALGGVAVSNLWMLGGNAGTMPGVNFVGTTDNQPLELKVNGARALRLEPTATSPNVVGGYSGNLVSNGVVGAVISGGGQLNNSNRVGGSFSTVGGGFNNVAYFGSAVVAGGDNNRAAQDRATVSGGFSNRATGLLSTVGGGDVNLASGQAATVPGGSLNEAAAAYAFAAGRRAKATNQGAFVWADSQNADFASTGLNQFLVRAVGGFGLNTNNPQDALHVGGPFIRVTGAGGEGAYLGGNGFANDVQLGSVNPSVTEVALFNRATSAYMDLAARHIKADQITVSNANGVSINGALRLNNSNLWLRAGSDLNHGLGWYGNGKPFAGASNVIDGPVLFGFTGGALGTEQFGTEKIALLWNSLGNVGINTNSPKATLDVNGSLRLNSGTIFTNLQAGQMTMAGGASSSYTNLVIIFPKAFLTPPKIVATASGDPGFDVPDTFVTSVRAASTTSCTVNIVRVDSPTGWSQALRINWIAWE